MTRSKTALCLALSLGFFPMMAQAEICVANGTDENWLFVAEADDGPRKLAELSPGSQLCVLGDAAGTVAVFASPDELEGCSRRVTAGFVEELSDFPSVDLCSWERHDGS